MNAYLHQVNDAPVLRVKEAHTRAAFDLLTRDRVLGLPLTNARTQLTDICLRRGSEESVTQALTAGGFTVHTDDPFSAPDAPPIPDKFIAASITDESMMLAEDLSVATAFFVRAKNPDTFDAWAAHIHEHWTETPGEMLNYRRPASGGEKDST